MEEKVTIQKMCLVGLMAAMVYVASAFLQIPIPTVIGNTRLHMGNVMCLLSGLLLGPLCGGMAAGIGSAFFDLTNPAYISSAPFTFVFKFLMAWLCGRLYLSFRHKRNIVFYSVVAAAAGNLLYIVLYLGQSFFEAAVFLQQPVAGVVLSVIQKGTVSTMNGVIAVIAAVPLSLAIRPALGKIMMRTI
ncbi:MAG: ECF transporter S component [Lachnospiraceae bacterium]